MVSTSLRHAQLWQGLAVLMLVALATLSLLPNLPQPGGVLGWDKLQHTAAYAFLAWWFLQAWEGHRPLFRCLLLVAAGCAIEAAQALTTWRQPSVLDVLANTLGVAIGGVFWRGPLGGVLARLDALAWGSSR